MKVLHLPANIASQISVTVRALNDIGINARGIVSNSSPIQETKGIRNYEIVSRKKYPIKGITQTLLWWREVVMGLHWADVVHWHFSTRALPREFDLKYAAFLNKARIVEFWGSDIRIPEIASADNPYFSRIYERGEGSSFIKSNEHSIGVQSRFSRYGFECLIPGCGLLAHTQKDLFPKPFRTMQRVMISDYEPKYPDPDKRRPLIVHVPSRTAIKGTEFVLKAIDSLKDSYDFDFKLVHNVPHAEAMDVVRNCDIMLDQFVFGGHGLAALETMAFGKPTFCYIKPSLVSEYPSDLPIVNANQDNLAEVLEKFLKNGQLRHEIGRKSRAYVQKYHDAHMLARNLVSIYKELIRRTHNKKK